MRHSILSPRTRLLLFGACLTASLLVSAAPEAASRRLMLLSGSVIPVRIEESLSSKTSQPGDSFTAAVRYGKGDADLPQGTRVEGVVREAVRSMDGKPGLLDLDFRRLTTPGGQVRAISGSPIALDSGSVLTSSSGQMVAKDTRNKDRLKFVGIGAGAGLLLGSLSKHSNKLTDALLGGAAGYAYSEFSKKKGRDVTLKAGTEIGIRLDKATVFDTNRDDSTRTSSYEDTYDARRSDATYDGAAETDRNRSIERGRDQRNEDIDSDDRYRNDSDDRVSRRLSSRVQVDDNFIPAPNEVRMRIDGRMVEFDSASPIVRNGQTLAPLKAVSLEAGFDYRYGPRDGIIRAGRNDELRMALNSRTVIFRGERYVTPVASEFHDGEIYVPIKFIALATGGSTTWDAQRREVNLTTGRMSYEPRRSRRLN